MYTIIWIVSAFIIHITLHYILEKEAIDYEEDLKFHLPLEENQSGISEQ